MITQSPQEVLNRAEAAIGRLRDVNVRLNAQSRFAVHVTTLQKVSAGDPSITDSRTTAHLELDQLVRIVGLLDCVNHESLIPKLQLMVKDPIVPEEARSETPGRDCQFELYLAARFAHGGLDVRICEPDIVVHVDQFRVGIAAKRPKSYDRLKARMNHARDQLHTQRARLTHGLIAIDATFMGNPELKAPRLLNTSDPKPLASQITSAVKSRLRPIIDPWGKAPSDLHLTGGALIVGTCLYYVAQATVVQTLIHSLRFHAASQTVLTKLRSAAQGS